jgi:hypothetical protein
MPDLNDIIDTCEHLLATINRVYQEAGIAIPARQYYVIGGQGQTVHDCEQVTVSWDQAYSGLPGNEASIPAVCEGPHTGSFIVEVVRPVNTARTPVDPMAALNPQAPNAKIPGRWGGGIGQSEMPTPEDYMREAKVQMQDAVLLLRAGLLAGEGTWGESAIVDVSAGSPQGGYQATIMNFTAVLGIQED